MNTKTCFTLICKSALLKGLVGKAKKTNNMITRKLNTLVIKFFTFVCLFQTKRTIHIEFIFEKLIIFDSLIFEKRMRKV